MESKQIQPTFRFDKVFGICCFLSLGKSGARQMVPEESTFHASSRSWFESPEPVKPRCTPAPTSRNGDGEIPGVYWPLSTAHTASPRSRDSVSKGMGIRETPITSLWLQPTHRWAHPHIDKHTHTYMYTHTCIAHEYTTHTQKKNLKNIKHIKLELEK